MPKTLTFLLQVHWSFGCSNALFLDVGLFGVKLLTLEIEFCVNDVAQILNLVIYHETQGIGLKDPVTAALVRVYLNCSEYS